MKIITDIIRKHCPRPLLDKLYNLIHDRLLENYYHTTYQKNALISYITQPFTTTSSDIPHNNMLEARLIAEILSAENYNVDIINYNSPKIIDFDKYDLIFGFGDPVVNSFHKRSKKITTIYYSTGSSIIHQNTSSLKRLEQCYNRTGQWFFDSARIVDKAWSVQTSLSDAIICLGSETISKTFSSITDKPVYSIPAFYHHLFDYEKIIEKQNVEEARKHFLWFGSTGFVHKGLDLLLSVFETMPDYHLHVCGPLYHDPKFEQYFYKQLHKTANIHCHGFVNIHSDTFRELLTQCAFTILPSCSEGCATSILNVMGNSGTIPILTPYCGLEPMDFAFNLDTISQEAIKTAIKNTQRLSDIELKKRSSECIAFTSCHYSIDNYKSSLQDALKTILSST